MATAKEFVARISDVDGVAGCLLTRAEGELLGSSLEDPDLYTPLMSLAATMAQGVMDKIGFSYCRYLAFNRAGKENFYLFLIDRFYLGVLLEAECYIPDMLQSVLRLIGRVTTGGATVKE